MADRLTTGTAARFLDQDEDLAFTVEIAGAPGAFEVRRFAASEALFDCFEIEIDLLKKGAADIPLSALMDTDACLTILDKYSEPRHLHGVVAEAESGESGFRRSAYRVVLRPALHRLRYSSDSRIFQDMTVPDIVTTLLEEHGVVDTEWRLAGTHLPREYCVQYAETAYDFVRRLLAEEGIFFFFEHGEAGHRMILSDAALVAPPLEHAAQITWKADPPSSARGAWVQRFTQAQRIRPTALHRKDYTFKQPYYGQDHRHGAQESAGEKAEYAIYDYPGRYKAPGAGKPFTEATLDAERVTAATGQGTTNSIHLSPGFGFTLFEHPDAAANIEHRVLGVSHQGDQPAALEEDAPAEAATTYAASFETQPARLPYRPTNPNPKPRVLGAQIAHVTGPAGEEIYCDEYGRVKVWFPWDRHGQKNEQSSCWVRVSQNWAGGTWGHIAIPRIGHEVIVDFLEGDPDQPIVTGRTYHAANMPPYPLPGHKTKMVIRSDTHKGQGYNEISFEDEAGREEVWMHAQKDHNLKILNNRSKSVGVDQSESVGNNKNIEVGSNHQEKIGGSMNITVGGGSGAPLMAALGAIVGMGGAHMQGGSGPTGNGAIGKFGSALAAVGALAESTSLGGNAAFNAAGDHFKEAGKAQQGTAASIGGLLSKIMPIGGIVSSVIEKFQSTTVGIASTEQIGVMKNTSVGHTETKQVGKYKKTVVGEEYVIEVGKSKMVMKSDGTVIIKGVRFHFEASGPVQVVGKVIDLN